MKPVGLAALLVVASLFSAPVFAAEPASVDGVAISASGNSTVVQIRLSTSTASYSIFRASNPSRLVVDITGAALGPAPEVSSGGLVSKAEFSSFQDGAENVRLTLFLTGDAQHEARVEGNSIVLTLIPGTIEDPLAALPEKQGMDEPAPAPVATSAPAEPAPADDPALADEPPPEPAAPAPSPAPAPTPTPAPASSSSQAALPTPDTNNSEGIRLSGPQAVAEGAVLTSLDFQQRDKSSRVILGLKMVDPVVSTPRADMIVIDLKGAVMPGSLRRQLDTRFFASAVDEIRAYATRDGTRVSIQLRMNSTYSVSREGELYVLEIATPPEILAQRDRALQRAAAAAPSGPDTNGTGTLSNAMGSEVMITGTGRRVDPQSKLGSDGSGSPDAFAFATEANTGGRNYTGRRVSIDLQDADIHTVFRFIAEYGDINIVSSDDVSGKVTVRLEDVPWDEALAAVLQAKGLGAQQFGNIIRVAPLEQIKAEQQAALDAQISQEKLAPLGIYVAPLNYAQADELIKQVESILSERGSVEVDARSNQLIVRDAEDYLAKVRQLLIQVDRPTRQITIDARFVEASSNFSRSLGITWGGSLDASAATGFPTGAFFPSSIGNTLSVDMGPDGPSSALDFSLGSIPGLIDLNVRLAAMEAEGWARTVSAPKLRVMDNETANVEQGARIPYLSTSNGGTQVQFVKAALELEVTPHITSEGYIFLDISLTNDRPDFARVIQGQPAIQTKQMNTRVLVADGDTAVIGGAYATTETFAQERVPGLGKIPLIGYLFRNSSSTREQNEMLIFITPRIVPVDEDPSASQ